MCSSMSDKERAEALRIAAEYLDGDDVFTPTTMRRIADGLDPPEPAIDTSLRGPVILEEDNGRQTVFYADNNGLHTDSRCDYVEWFWGQLVNSAWTVRKLTSEDIGYRIRQWDEWTQEEQDRWTYVCIEPRDHANLAIEIATRQGDV